MTAVRVVAIIVTYQPELQALGTLLSAVLSQVEEVIVVDNGSSIDIAGWLAAKGRPHLHCIALRTNRGVAAAHNIGIGWARDCGATHIVLFDHDSLPEPDMVKRLLESAEQMVQRGFAVAAVGPRYIDARQDNPPPFIRIRGIKVERCRCEHPDSIVRVDYLISSGCLIPMTTLDSVGGMREELFIDYVDIEWGLRARHRGFQAFGACAAGMHHSLGEEPITFFGRKLPLHSPLRHYYHFRNAVWLYRQSWVPLNWKLADGYRLLLKYGFYTLFARPRLQHLQMMTLGIWHGLCGKMGISDLKRG